MLTAEKLNDLRKRVIANEPFTYEELAAAVKQLIADRLASFEKPAAKSKPKAVNLDDLI
jgi:predicted Zn-dependent peptidase